MDQYTLPANVRKLCFVLMGIGLLGLIYGLVMDDPHKGQRIWGNVLINGFFFFGISLCGLFFIALSYVAQAGWGTPLKRIFEAVSLYMPYGAGFLVLVWLVGSFHGHHLYHWMDPEVHNPASEHYDEIIANKGSYLNLPFFWLRSLVYLGIWIWVMRIFRKRSLEEDTIGGADIHRKNVKLAAGFMVFLAVTSSTSSWDWLMSIDTHWFSTMFGWYVFGGLWISGITVFILLTLYLKRKGYLEQVNENHIHDLGKWMFAISFLWSYLWFFQFMLIWYADIPEEVTYYQARVEDYKVLFYGMFLINFALPMTLLMARDSKRNYVLLNIVGLIIFFGHWLDVWLMVTPGTMGAHGHIGILEICMALGFTGLFLFVVLTRLSKAPIMVKSHPFLEESLHHEQ